MTFERQSVCISIAKIDVRIRPLSQTLRDRVAILGVGAAFSFFRLILPASDPWTLGVGLGAAFLFDLLTLGVSTTVARPSSVISLVATLPLLFLLILPGTAVPFLFDGGTLMSTSTVS